MRISDWSSDVCSSDLDLYLSYAQRGNLPWMERAAAGVLELFPQFSRMRFLRQWAGIVDVVHDSTPIIGPTSVGGLYINGGWGTGGFKAVPAGGWCLAHVMATGQSHKSEEHTSELQSLMRISYAGFCLKQKSNQKSSDHPSTHTTPPQAHP